MSMPPETRALIGELAEKLLDAGNAMLALLDELDGDADLEDSDSDGECSEDEISTAAQATIAAFPGCELPQELENSAQPLDAMEAGQ
jgi:hypothetical protein